MVKILGIDTFLLFQIMSEELLLINALLVPSILSMQFLGAKLKEISKGLILVFYNFFQKLVKK